MTVRVVGDCDLKTARIFAVCGGSVAFLPHRADRLFKVYSVSDFLILAASLYFSMCFNYFSF